MEGRSTQDSAQLVTLLKTFKAERPRPVIVFPRWDLPLVLRVLRKAPYEPLRSVDKLHLTRKCVFLLLLASARRVSDIHAIDPRRITHRKDDIVLVPNPRYLPKIIKTAEGDECFSPIIIKRLSSLTDDPEELALCPARALQVYDSYARRLCLARQQFFISLRSPTQTVKKQTVSAWVVALIRHAYTTATDDDCRL